MLFRSDQGVQIAPATVVTDPAEAARFEAMADQKAPSVRDQAPDETVRPSTPDRSGTQAAQSDEKDILDILIGGGDGGLTAEDVAAIQNEMGGADEPAPRGPGDSSIDLETLASSGDLADYMAKLQDRRGDMLYELGFKVLHGTARLPERFAPLLASVKEATLGLEQSEAELAALDRDNKGVAGLAHAEYLARRKRVMMRIEKLQGRIGRRYRRLGKAVFLDERLTPPIPDLHRKLRQTEDRIILLQSKPSRR